MIVYTSFINKPNGHSGFDKLENKHPNPNPYNYTKTQPKFSRFDRLNSSTLPNNDDRGISPLRCDNSKVESHKDLIMGSGSKKPGRLKTDESDKLKRIDASFDCMYVEKSKVPLENKKKVIPHNSRALSNNRVGRNPVIKEQQSNLLKNVDESLREPKRKGVYPLLHQKKISAQIDKVSQNNCLDTSLPTILVNGTERYRKEKSQNSRFTGLNNDKSDTQVAESPRIILTNQKETFLSKFSQPITKMPEIKTEHVKSLKWKESHKKSSSPNHHRHESSTDSYYLMTNIRNSSSFIGETTLISPAKDPRKENKNVDRSSFLEDVNTSLNTTQNPGDSSIAIDYAFDKVTELTNKNNIARYDLLKIQESALELQMRLHARRAKQQRPLKGMSRTNQTFVEDLNSYNSLFAMDSEL